MFFVANDARYRTDNSESLPHNEPVDHWLDTVIRRPGIASMQSMQEEYVLCLVERVYIQVRLS